MPWPDRTELPVYELEAACAVAAIEPSIRHTAAAMPRLRTWCASVDSGSDGQRSSRRADGIEFERRSMDFDIYYTYGLIMQMDDFPQERLAAMPIQTRLLVRVSCLSKALTAIGFVILHC